MRETRVRDARSEAVSEGVSTLFRVGDTVLCIAGCAVSSQASADEIFSERPLGEVDVLLEKSQQLCCSAYNQI